MVIERIYVNNATHLSLSDRFTIIQQHAEAEDSYSDPYANPTPVGRVAMQLKKIPLKQRIGGAIRAPNSQSLFRNGGALLSPGRSRGRGSLGRFSIFSNLARTRRRSLSRVNSFGNISRSSSYNDLSEGSNGNSFRRQHRTLRRGGGGGFRNKTFNSRLGDRGRGWRGRGRGGRRGRGRGRGRGGWDRDTRPPPCKEDLDRELDQYMAGSKAQLDRELDTYMVNYMDTE